MTINMWICSDPDSSQHLRKINESCWECYEMRGPFPEFDREKGPVPAQYGVVHLIIDLDCYDEDDIQDYISGYGYRDRDELAAQYGDAAEQIIVECVFECTDDGFVFTGSEQDCDRYIKENTNNARCS